MSLSFLLDGYNIIKNMPEFAPLKLEAGRLQLIRMIETRRPQGSLNNKVTVVFDGRSDVVSPPISESVKVVFSSDETADEKIKRMVQETPAKKQTVVVSDDRDLRYAVRALGASVLRVDEFVKRLRPGGKPRTPTPPGKQIPKALEYEITSELERLWLEEEE